MPDNTSKRADPASIDPQTGSLSQAYGLRDPARVDPPWVSDYRVTIPGRVTDHLERTALVERCMPTNQRLTILQAPGGFGKSTVLADCCRTLAARGVPTAWLSLSEEDDPPAMEIYLAVAFQRAGLNVLESLHSTDSGLQTSSDRTSVLLQALDAYGEPCVLALDELERMGRGECVALLNALVRNSPFNLHLAIACREFPPGLDIVDPVFRGAAQIVTAEDLRFSKPEIAQLFERKLSQRELTALAADSAGWPIAVRIHRNAKTRPARALERVVRDLVENWVESRLWHDVSEEDREFVLDVGLLDWFDDRLLDEALAGAGLMARLDGLSDVAGLVEPLRGDANKIWRLHPMIGEHCRARRRRETPDRYRSIHRRIAAELAGRGETVSAMQHAVEADDAELAGWILTDAGGIRLWLREGSDRLLAAERLLSDATLGFYPRLGLARVLAQTFQGRIREARRTYEAVERDLQSDASGEDLDLDADLCLAWGIVVQNGCERIGSASFQRLATEIERLADLPGVDTLVGCTMEYGLCQIHTLKGEFDSAAERGIRAHRRLGTRSLYLSMAVDFQLGEVAMAQGRVPEALERYGRSLRAAKRMFLHDPRLTVLGEVLIREVNLERNQMAEVEIQGPRARQFWLRGAQFSSYAAASAIAAELMLDERGADAALTLMDEMWEHSQRTELPALVRYLAALRTAMLAAAGQTAEAEWTWRTGALPQSTAECFDLDGQSWREMEAIACTRLRLLVLRGDFDAGRHLARHLVDVATSRGLRRTGMRALILALTLEEAAGDRAAATDNLRGFLGLFAETDYARPLVRERDVALPVLESWLHANPESPHRASAEWLVTAAKAGTDAGAPLLSSREAAVLALLETGTDRQIGEALGLSRGGVRYHLHHLFAKLKVRNRVDAVDSARSLGLLVPGGQ